MKISFEVHVEVERVQGKFASKDDIADLISDWLETANEDSISGVGADGDSEYEILDWQVNRV